MSDRPIENIYKIGTFGTQPIKGPQKREAVLKKGVRWDPRRAAQGLKSTLGSWARNECVHAGLSSGAPLPMPLLFCSSPTTFVGFVTTIAVETVNSTFVWWSRSHISQKALETAYAIFTVSPSITNLNTASTPPMKILVFWVVA
jgi:hypothetical protein